MLEDKERAFKFSAQLNLGDQISYYDPKLMIYLEGIVYEKQNKWIVLDLKPKKIKLPYYMLDLKTLKPNKAAASKDDFAFFDFVSCEGIQGIIIKLNDSKAQIFTTENEKLDRPYYLLKRIAKPNKKLVALANSFVQIFQPKS